VGTRFFAHVQTSPGAHPASCTMGTGSIPGVKRSERGANHTTSFSRRGLERVELEFYSPFRPHMPVIGSTLPLTFTTRCLIQLSRWHMEDNLKEQRNYKWQRKVKFEKSGASGEKECFWKALFVIFCVLLTMHLQLNEYQPTRCTIYLQLHYVTTPLHVSGSFVDHITRSNGKWFLLYC
jgi:hypothetical protein